MAAETEATAGAISDAKETFKRLLIQHNGDAKHPEAKEALDNLVQLAAKERGDGGEDDDGAEWSPAHGMEANAGRWRTMTTPHFVGKLPDSPDGKRRYTLGRMSFGMFKPTKLVCALDDIINIVLTVDEEEGGTKEQQQNKEEDAPLWKQTYTVEVLMQIETPRIKLPAKLTTHGVCFPQSNTRLGVHFPKGVLEPRFDLASSDNASLAAVWKETFDMAIAKEAETQSYLGQLGTWTTHKLMKMMMGLEPPIDKTDFTQTFIMRKPYPGHLDILYLDEDFRVTRGNKGTIVAVERLADENKD